MRAAGQPGRGEALRPSCAPASGSLPNGPPASAPAVSSGGKPAIVFVSEESCPFCAAERWSLAVALSRFGTWSHLGATTSSATDVYPNTATLSFRTAVYRSTELTLRTTELADKTRWRRVPGGRALSFGLAGPWSIQ